MALAKWTTANIPDQQGRVVIVTGATSGIGLYAAIAPEAKSGEFYGPDGFITLRGYPQKEEPKALAKDPVIAEKLWDVSGQLTGMKYKIE